MRISLVLFLFLNQCYFSCFSQILPLTRLFSPSIEVSAESEHPSRFTGYDPIYTGADVTFRYSYRSKLGLSIDLKNITKQGKIKGIRGWIRPIASQLMGVVNVGYREMKFKETPVMEAWKIRGGFTGMALSRRFRLFYYTGTIGVSEQLFKYTKRLYPDVRLTFGGAKIYDLRSAVVYGAYIRFYNRTVLPSPFVGYSTRIAKRVNISILLPVRFETTYKINKNYRQSLIVSLNNRSSGVVNFTEFKAAFPNAYYDSFNVKFGSSAYLRLNRETEFIISGGFMTDHTGNLYIDSEAFDPLSTSAGIYLKLTLLTDLQKSLISTRGILQSFE